MTSLRSFQTEIDEIHHREAVKQRLQTLSEQGGLRELLLANDTGRARDLVASILTRRRGELVFRIGVRPAHDKLFAGGDLRDSDPPQGVPRMAEEVDILCARIAEVVDELGGKTSALYKISDGPPRAALLLRLPPPSVALTPEVRCAVVGNVDSGKSTTLGVLTRGALDDGRGRARVSLFRHKHEIESGRTSSVGMEILGFGSSGEPILPLSSHANDPEAIRHERMSWEAISIQAAKIVSFIDLAGHERYLKTTLYGLTSGAPSCVILIVGANAGLIGMSKEHLAIALALSVPVVVCITKIDMTPLNKLAETIKQVTKILKSPGCRKTPVFVKTMEQAVEISEVFAKQRLCPIFQLSNVTGQGLDFLRTFLNLLPPSEGDTEKFTADQALEYCVTEVWSVPYVGTVVDGIVNSGRLKAGDAIVFGPDSNGKFESTAIKSIQRKRAPVNSAEAGQCVSLALKRVRRAAVRKGMVIVHKTDAPPPRAVRQFEGQVLILYHNTTLQKNYQAMLHCGAIRQTVRILSMDHPQGVLRTGDRATVTFEFISHPEFLKEGMKLLFREGKTKGLGVVTKLL
ncbi:uncharacterized protein PHACADRAFT_174976 [Phanerochaete carnosa HHB-10118-sp]|uniref:Tr-type G domain-containing protein n=1 Tax=Phanerochaete carnosa (strain HHB-10118-sp) TaxID=650164 RepID=K5UWP0_PHACS|nr:uncharacterized protein PHACADRAFT_174976 [Phanerochaete carnosa HHB-10118-sp]EKM54471.1 hypothetical protein PHACADRAFT_174976 [Phanerochaete carnosa HHB-10118-sp]